MLDCRAACNSRPAELWSDRHGRVGKTPTREETDPLPQSEELSICVFAGRQTLSGSN